MTRSWKVRGTALAVSAALLAGALPGAGAVTTTVTGTGALTLTVGSPYLTANGLSSLIDAEGTTPVVKSPGYTMLPLRGVVEAMGGTLAWNATTRQITIIFGGQTEVLTIGSTAATVSGVYTQLATAPELTSDGRTLVHIRALEQFTGVSCSWNGAAEQVGVTYPIYTTVADEEGPEGDTLMILTNETGEEIDSVKWAANDGGSWSSNVLPCAVLGDDETEYIWLDLDGDPEISLKVTYAEGGSETYTDIDLTDVDEAFSISIQDDGDWDDLDDEDVPEMESKRKVAIENRSEFDKIAGLYRDPAGEDYDDYDDLIDDEHDESTLDEDDGLSFTLTTDDEPLWELYIVYDDDDETDAVIEDISLVGAEDEVTIVITDEDEAYRVLDDNTVDPDDSETVTARLYNDLGSEYTITYLYASLADESDWEDLLSDELEDGDYITETFDLSDGSEWDFKLKVEDEDGDTDTLYYYGVDFDDADDDWPYLYFTLDSDDEEDWYFE